MLPGMKPVQLVMPGIIILIQLGNKAYSAGDARYEARYDAGSAAGRSVASTAHGGAVYSTTLGTARNYVGSNADANPVRARLTSCS